MTGSTPERRRRILMAVTAGESGGAQVHVIALSEALRNNHDLHIVTGSCGYLTEQAARLGIPVTVIPELGREISPAADLTVVRRFVDLVRATRPDLVHCHSSKVGVLGRLAAAVTNTPAVFTAHGWAFKPNVPISQRGPAFVSELVLGRLLPRQRVIAVSEADRVQAIRSHVCRPARIRTIWNGVPDDNRRATPTPGRAHLVSVARLAPPKDHDTLLHAMTQLPDHVHLTLVGDGPRRDELTALSHDLGLERRVHMLGDRSDVAEVLATADLFVLASKKEGLPLSILEAMRSGLPVVASDVGGVREAVRHQSTGLVVRPNETADLVSALSKLIGDDRRRAAYGAEGRRLYEQNFRVETMVEQTIRVYDSLAGPRIADNMPATSVRDPQLELAPLSTHE